MSIFRFSAEFHFFFFTFRFFENHFPLFFLKLPTKKKQTGLQHHHCRESSKGLPLSGEFTELRYADARFFVFWSKFESAVSPLGTRNLTPAAVRRLDEGRWGWWLGGGMVEGLEMIVTEPALTIELQHLHPPPSPPPLLSHINLHRHVHTGSHTHTHTHTHIHTHTHTHRVNTHTHTHTHTHIHTHTQSGIFTPIFSLQESVCLSLSHTHREDFSRLFLTNTHACTAVSVASSEHARNSMTGISPYFNPSPFPLTPLQPTTAQSLQEAGNRHQFFLTIRVKQSHLSA